MAVNQTSAYAIGVTITSDASGFATGVQQAETAMAGLATTTQTAAADIDTALATDVPASADASAVNLTTKASKFKAVGTELGTSVVSGLSQGMSGPEAVTNSANSLSGLLAASASTAGGAIAAVGIGAGVAIVAAIAQGMNESKERIASATQEVFDNLELTAKTSLHDIRQAIFDTFSLENKITEIGAGNFADGMEKVQQVVDDTGISFDGILDLITQGINPGTRETYERLVEAREEGTKLHGLFYNSRIQMDGTAKNADDLLGNIQETDVAMRRARDAAQSAAGYFDRSAENSDRLRSATNGVASLTERSADAMERYAAAADRAAAAAQRLNDRAGLNGNADTAS